MKSKIQINKNGEYLLGTFLLLMCLGTSSSFTSIPNPVLSEALRLKREWRYEEALKKFNQVLSTDANNLTALNNASLILSKLAPGQETNRKRDYLLNAKELAAKSIALDQENWESHFSYVAAIGFLTEVTQNPWEKVKYVKVIKKEALRLIELAPDSAQGYFILGKWNYELAQLTWVEKAAGDVLFGGIPKGASIEKAVEHYQRAIELRPDAIAARLGIGEAWYYLGDTARAINSLEFALRLPNSLFNDFRRREKCRKLLEEWKSS